MKDFRKIVVGVSLTPQTGELTTGSRVAIHQATWLAKQTGAMITCVHSTEKEYYYDPLSRGYLVVSEGVPPQGHETLDRLREEFAGKSIESRIRVDENKPWLSIIQEVLQWEADLVVVGRHDDTDEEVHKLGSISSNLLRKCPVPVWAVRPGHENEPRCVVAATDLTPVGARVLELAAYISSNTGADLHVVHCYQKPMVAHVARDRESKDESAARMESIRGSAVASIRETLAALKVEDKVHLHVACHSPIGGTLAIVEKLDPDLLIMGSVSRGGVPGLLVGNTAEKIIDRVSCSLLTVKPKDFVSPITLEQLASSKA